MHVNAANVIAPELISERASWIARRDGVVAALALLLIAGAGLLLTLQAAESIALGELRTDLSRLAGSAALLVDGDAHEALVSPEQTGGKKHLQALAPLVRFHRQARDIYYVYTARLENDQIKLVLSTNYQYRIEGDEAPPDFIGQVYADEEPEFKRALVEQIALVNAEPVRDSVGTFLSAFVPIQNSDGKFVGVLGIDMELSRVQDDIRRLRTSALGSYGLVMAAAVLMGVVVTRVSKRRAEARQIKVRALKMLADAERTDALANMAGSIAHEFSQKLAVALGHLEFLRDLELGAGGQRDLAIAQASLERAVELVDTMRALTGHRLESIEHFSIRSLLDGVEQRLSERGTDLNRLQVMHDGVDANVRGGRRALEQALVHLVTNALEANPQTPVHIRVLEVEPGNSLQGVWFGSQNPGKNYIAIEIRDAGPGLSEEDKRHALEPFYSTKFKGRGLGLAIVRSVLQAHHAVLLAENLEPGLRLSVLLPCA